MFSDFRRACLGWNHNGSATGDGLIPLSASFARSVFAYPEAFEFVCMPASTRSQ